MPHEEIEEAKKDTTLAGQPHDLFNAVNKLLHENAS
jgi:hypothetical protein